jgi:hypothetical protein
MQAPTTQTADSDDQRRCVSCGYPLRGLAVGSSCPECGFQIHSISATDVPLDQASAEVVYGLAWRLGITVALVVFLVPGLFISIALLFDDRRPAFAVSLGVVIPIGSWLLTKGWQEPSAIFNDLGPTSRVRVLTRWGGGIWIFFGIFGVLTALSGSWSRALSLSLELGRNFTLLAGLVQVILLGVVLERMARWMRDEVGAQGARFASFAVGVILVGVIAGSVVKLVYNPSAPLLQSVSTLLIVVVLVGAILLLGRFTKNALFSIVHMHHNLGAAERSAEARSEHQRDMVERTIGQDQGEETGHL